MSYDRTTGPGPQDEVMPPATWTWRDLGISILMVVGAFLATSFAIALPFEVAFGAEADEAHFATGLATVVFDLAVVAGIFGLVQASGGGWRNLGFQPPGRGPMRGRAQSSEGGTGFPWGYTARIVVLGFVAAMMSVTLYGIAIEQAGLEDLLPDRQIPEDYFDNPFVIGMLGVGVVIGAPIAEEIFFRGFLFWGMRRYWGFLPAGLVSGLIFSAVHFQVGLIVPFTLVGLILAFVYYRSGSLIPSILVHGAFNSFSFIVLLLFPEAR